MAFLGSTSFCKALILLSVGGYPVVLLVQQPSLLRNQALEAIVCSANLRVCSLAKKCFASVSSEMAILNLVSIRLSCICRKADTRWSW